MWKTYNNPADAESFLRSEGFRQVGNVWERGERFVSFSRVEIGRCNNGRFIISHVEHVQ